MQKTSEDALIEVYNIDFELAKVGNEKTFKNFIIKRLESKIDNKTKELEKQDKKLIFISVLWGNVDAMLSYIDIFRCIHSIPYCGYMMTVSKYIDRQGKINFVFESVVDRLNNIREYGIVDKV